MCWWDHAVMLRLRLGRWAEPVALRHYEQEAEDQARMAGAGDGAACQPAQAPPKRSG